MLDQEHLQQRLQILQQREVYVRRELLQRLLLQQERQGLLQELLRRQREITIMTEARENLQTDMTVLQDQQELIRAILLQEVHIRSHLVQDLLARRVQVQDHTTRVQNLPEVLVLQRNQVQEEDSK